MNTVTAERVVLVTIFRPLQVRAQLEPLKVPKGVNLTKCLGYCVAVNTGGTDWSKASLVKVLFLPT